MNTLVSHREIGLKEVILVWLALLLLFENAKGVSNEEYLEMKKYLKSVNKPALKTIKTKYGDIFHCIDIYKQPAFDHPLLKNHTLQMRPSSFPRGAKDEIPFVVKSSGIGGFIGGGCPEGTVPIRRICIQDLLRAKELYMFRDKYTGNTSYTSNTTSSLNLRGHHWATNGAKEITSFGTRVTMNVWRPKVSNANQFSLGQFWIKNGPPHDLNSIEAGWMVFPKRFGDQRTRLFTFWTANGYKTSCYDVSCPGFVHLNKNIPLGAVIEPVSTYSGRQIDLTFQVFKDPNTSNWILTVGDNDEVVGYWPNAIFTHLKENAESVDWGGETWTQMGRRRPVYPNPPMGSGHFPSEGGFTKSSYMRNIQIVDASHRLVDAPQSTAAYADTPKCYGVNSFGGEASKGWGRFFYFGGPGGVNC